MSDYLIIGGTGSLGKQLIQRLLPHHDLAVYSRDEAKHWTIRNVLSAGPLASRAREGLQFYVGDVRDAGRLRDVIRQASPRNVIVASALKRVDTCEASPGESIQTNLVGVRNVIDVISAPSTPGPIRLLLVSTDKACSPVNVYGMCKALAERVVTSQAATAREDVYLAVRYGNVLESRGSIVPLFRYQAEHGECLTLTDPDMTRFVMTLDESVDLILEALESGRSGETWVPRLPSMRIGDLAAWFAARARKPLRVIGLRPGEKLHEELVNESESPRTRREGVRYVIGPALAPGAGKRFTYTSAECVMSPEALGDMLERLAVLPMDKFIGRSIEEIATNGGQS